MRIRKLKNGNLLVPMRAETNGIIGDGVVEIKVGDKDYLKYLEMFEEEKNMTLSNLFSILKSFPGHAGRPGHVGGSAPGSGGAVIETAKKKIIERATKLGYQNIEFLPPNKKGLVQLVAGGPKGGKPKKEGLFIAPDGKIVNKKGDRIPSWDF